MRKISWYGWFALGLFCICIGYMVDVVLTYENVLNSCHAKGGYLVSWSHWQRNVCINKAGDEIKLENYSSPSEGNISRDTVVIN